MNSDYYFQKGLTVLIVTGVVVLALIILFLWYGLTGISALAGACLACPRRTWRGRILLFQPGQFGRSFGTVFPSVWA